MSAPQCQAMVQELLAYAPILRPRICPKGFEDNAFVHLCKTDTQRDQISNTLQQMLQKTKCCTICHSKGTLTPVTEWKIDFTNGLYKLSHLHFCCDLCYKDNQVIYHFFTTNKISTNNNQQISLKQRSIFQQWFSLCYSLQLFAGYANLRVIDHCGQSFTESTDFDALIKSLMSPNEGTNKKKKRKSPKRKEQPRKRFKKQ